MAHTDWQALVGLPQISVGKVRHMFSISEHDDYLLMLASDRLSTHNIVHTSEIPGKGENLTALTLFWATQVFPGKVETHIHAYGKAIYDYFNVELPANLHRRAVIVRKCQVPQKEFIWRSYLTGSLYDLYIKGKDPHGLGLPDGLLKMHHFEREIFTPTEKNKNDDPLNADEVAKAYVSETFVTRKARRIVQDYLASRGIALVDDKWEALFDMIVDEFGTGDCCRMAFIADLRRAQQYGEEVAWLDKQVARDLAEQMWDEKQKYPLTFTPWQIEQIVARYEQAFTAIVGMPLVQWQAMYLD